MSICDCQKTCTRRWMRCCENGCYRKKKGGVCVTYVCVSNRVVHFRQGGVSVLLDRVSRWAVREVQQTGLHLYTNAHLFPPRTQCESQMKFKSQATTHLLLRPDFSGSSMCVCVCLCSLFDCRCAGLLLASYAIGRRALLLSLPGVVTLLLSLSRSVFASIRDS